MDYTFVSLEQFKALESSGHLLESGEFDGQCETGKLFAFNFKLFSTKVKPIRMGRRRFVVAHIVRVTFCLVTENLSRYRPSIQ